jgi:hypothetical protein
MLDQMNCGQTDTFMDRGSRLILADLISTPNVRLSLQRYTVYWEAQCSIGPKECNVWMKQCKTCGSKATYGCKISWTMYDVYDFEPWNPWRFTGNPFYEYGYWSGAASGTVMSLQNN